LGNQALFASAERNGTLSTVEDELFRFGRILDGEPGLSTLLDDQTESLERRQGLLRSLIDGKVDPSTVALVHQALARRRRGFAMQVQNLAADASGRQGRSIAQVRSAVPLNAAQEARLAQLLSDTYGRSIGVRVEVDPSVRGGLVIRVGDELIDGSVATRLAAVRSALAEH
jgi:F-type H+-transporting ATPase subunit delta